MGLFGFGKKREVVDLGERYRQQQEKVSQIKADAEDSTTQDSGAAPFPFFAADSAQETPTETSSESDNITSALDPSERRRRLVKRLKDMTDRMEDLSNQIYRLQQRVEVLERKV